MSDVAMVPCFACGVKQSARVPDLHRCIGCGVEFRTMWNEAGVSTIEVSEVAKRRLTKRSDGVA